MKKKICAFIGALVLLASMATATAALRWNATYSCDMSLTFSGTTANCFVNINAYENTATIDGTVKLMRGSATLATWPLSGKGSASVTESLGCTSGQTYTMVVNATVIGSDGTDNIHEYVNNTCP